MRRNRTVANTQHGIDYQVHLGMFWGLFYALENNTTFTLRTEVQDEGKFDDLVISLPTGVTAFQIKHHLVNRGHYTLSNFISNSKSNKTALYVFFDSVFDQIRSEHRPGDHDFCFLSNHEMPTEFIPYIDQINGKFKPNFYQYSQYNQVYIAIYNSILSNSIRIRNVQKNLVGQYINGFLNRLQFRFSYLNSEQIVEEIKVKIRKKFNTINIDAIYHTFFHEFYKWTIQQEPRTWTNVEINMLLEHWYNNYILSERIVGATQEKLRYSHFLESHKFDRTIELKNLTDSMNNGNKKIIFMTGPAGIGKTTLVKYYFSQCAPLDGEFVFLNIRELFLFEKIPHINNLANIKLLFIDDVELIFHDTNLYTNLFNLLNSKIDFRSNLKLILLSRNNVGEKLTKLISPSYVPVDQTYILEINTLSDEIIINSLKNNNIQSQFTRFAQKKLDCNLLKIPFYLNLFISNPEHLHDNIDLHDYLIESHIKKAHCKKNISNFEYPGLIKERKKILRQLIFSKRKNGDMGDMFVPLQGKTNIVAINSLISDGIINSHEEKYCFSHRLYEEWTVNHIIKKTINRIMEEQRHPKSLFKYLSTYLPNYNTYFFTNDTIALINRYARENLIENYEETVKYLIKKNMIIGLEWLVNYFIQDIYDVTGELEETLIDAAQRLKECQNSKDEFLITSVFDSEGLFSIYEFVHKFSTEIYLGDEIEGRYLFADEQLVLECFDQNYSISSRIISDLISALINANPSINLIGLVDLKMNDKSLRHILKSLRKNNITYLKGLGLANNQIGNDGVYAIWRFSKYCYIEGLDLNCNEFINDYGAKYLAKILLFRPLAACEYVKTIDIRNTSIKEIGLFFINAARLYREKPLNLYADYISRDSSEDEEEAESCAKPTLDVHEVILMLAIEEDKIEFMSGIVTKHKLSIHKKITYYADQNFALQEIYMSPLDYAIMLYGETDELVEALRNAGSTVENHQYKLPLFLLPQVPETLGNHSIYSVPQIPSTINHASSASFFAPSNQILVPRTPLSASMQANWGMFSPLRLPNLSPNLSKQPTPFSSLGYNNNK